MWKRIERAEFNHIKSMSKMSAIAGGELHDGISFTEYDADPKHFRSHPLRVEHFEGYSLYFEWTDA